VSHVKVDEGLLDLGLGRLVEVAIIKTPARRLAKLFVRVLSQDEKVGIRLDNDQFLRQNIDPEAISALKRFEV
jgi:hypothetical protein